MLRYLLVAVGALSLSSCGAAGYVTLKDGMSLSQDQCATRKLTDTVLVVHSLRCGPCLEAMPILKEIDSQFPNMSFRYLEVTLNADALDALKIAPGYTPAVVANCKVAVGLRSKSEYLSLIDP